MSSESQAYYRSTLALLRHVEARQPSQRRFGDEADALWAQFKGELTTLDRLDTLLRDADAQWPGAFGARNVFHLPGVAEDETFGSEWQSISGLEAEALWKTGTQIKSEGVDEVLTTLAESWDLELRAIDVGTIAPADHVLVVGPSATASLIQAFVGKSDLDWAEQVTVIATGPAARQIAVAAGAILGSTKATRLFSSEAADLDRARTHLKGKPARLLESPDASPDDLAAAKSIVGAS